VDRPDRAINDDDPLAIQRSHAQIKLGTRLTRSALSNFSIVNPADARPGSGDAGQQVLRTLRNATCVCLP
jgi:hypothetical protein